MNHTGEWSEWQKVKETVKFGGCGELGNVGRKVISKTNIKGGWGGGIVRRVSEREAGGLWANRG